MDNRAGNETTQLQETIDRMLSSVNTCIPGIIESFDPATQTASVVPAVGLKTYIDGKVETLPLPKIINVPLVYPFAITKGFALTLPVCKDDPCLLFFSQRAIDNWHDTGGFVTTEPDGVSSRHHDLTDAFVMLAASPIPDVLGAWESNGIEIRNRPHDSRVTVHDENIEIVRGATSIVLTNDSITMVTSHVHVTASDMTIDVPTTTWTGDINLTGKLAASGLITSATDVVATGISGNSHTHGGVDPGPGSTGGPQ